MVATTVAIGNIIMRLVAIIVITTGVMPFYITSLAAATEYLGSVIEIYVLVDTRVLVGFLHYPFYLFSSIYYIIRSQILFLKLAF